MTDGTQSAGRRLSVITIDQAIAGASNVLIAVLAARLLSVASFGLFGIVFLVYVMVQGISRALVCDPLLVHPVEGQERLGEVIGTSFVLGPALAVGVLVCGGGAHFVEPDLGAALLVLAPCVPLLVLQDLGRYVAFAIQRPASALALDLVWLVLQVAAVAALFVTDTRTLAWFIAAWAGSGAAAGVLVLVQHRGVAARPTASWLRYTWSFSWRYLISYTSTISAALAASIAVGAIAGAKALGAVQGAMLLVRPFATFQVAAIAAGVGEIARARDDMDRLRRRVRWTSAATTSVAAVNLVVLLVLPDALGRAVLGASWVATQPLLLATGLQIMCLGAMTGVRAGLLGLRAIRQVMLIDLATTVAVLVVTVPGAILDGARGALWAVTLAQGVMVAVWWLTFSTHTKGPDAVAVPNPLTAMTVPTSPPA